MNMSDEVNFYDNKADLNQNALESASSQPPSPTNIKILTILDAPLNGKVYLIGTAHFSLESQREVSEIIRRVQPNRVVLELCSARSSMLTLDEAKVIQEAKEMNLNQIIKLIKETSVIHGILHSLMIRMYAKVTEELGIAPGGEFRVAYNEALQVPGCKVILGDMPIALTLRRGFNSLPWYRKLKLAWVLLTTDSKITKEDIEQLKNSDMLDTLMKEFGTIFPEFKKVLIDERNMYLTSSLRSAFQPLPNELSPGEFLPTTVVGVVGLGHVAGIKNIWDKEIDLTEIIRSQKLDQHPSKKAKYFKLVVIFGICALIGFKLTK